MVGCPKQPPNPRVGICSSCEFRAPVLLPSKMVTRSLCERFAPRTCLNGLVVDWGICNTCIVLSTNIVEIAMPVATVAQR